MAVYAFSYIFAYKVNNANYTDYANDATHLTEHILTFHYAYDTNGAIYPNDETDPLFM